MKAWIKKGIAIARPVDKETPNMEAVMQMTMDLEGFGTSNKINQDKTQE